jgi:hypothetical protein
MNRGAIALTTQALTSREIKTHGGSMPDPSMEFALAGIISAMTLVEITFELQSPLTAKQLADLAEFANTYGLRRFRHHEKQNLITFEYDASRLRQSQVVHALAGANIAVKRIVPQSGQEEIIPA